MAYEPKDMTGSIWPNDKKGNAKAPDGRKYYSLRIELKEQPPAQSTTQPTDDQEGCPF